MILEYLNKEQYHQKYQQQGFTTKDSFLNLGMCFINNKEFYYFDNCRGCYWDYKSIRLECLTVWDHIEPNKFYLSFNHVGYGPTWGLDDS